MLKKKFQNMILICFFDNTNLTEINSMNNNHNVTLINDYLVVQATSVSSEQIFSVAKQPVINREYSCKSALKLGMKQILKIIRKINKISTNII